MSRPANKTPIVPKTEGQRLLLERPESPSEIARLTGLALQRIDDYRSGRVRPSGPNARKLGTVLLIPVASWSKLVAAPPPVALEPSPKPRGQVSTLAEVESLLEGLRGSDADLDPRERKRRMGERLALLALKARIEKADALANDAIVRAHPLWRKIKEALRETLRKHPDALSDVVAALSALAAWDDASAEVEAASGSEEPTR